MSNYNLVGAFKGDKERGEYVGVITKVPHDLGGEIEVVAIGSEMTEFEILEWLRNTIKAMRDKGDTNVQAADMYARAGIHDHKRG